jgi:predicted ATPase
LWLLGFPDQAVERSHQAADHAREKLDLYGLSIALFNAAKVHQLRGEPEATAEYAQALLSLAEEQAFPVWIAAGTILAGWADARLGQRGAGTARIRQGIAAWLANGAAMMHPHFLGLLAEALSADGQVDEGLDVLERALTMVEETGERYYEAELHRLRGELLLTSTGRNGRTADAQSSFQKALEVARRQNALSMELRAAVSAVQFVWRQSKSDHELANARSILKPVCELFSEGFETFDWHAATSLLDA